MTLAVNAERVVRRDIKRVEARAVGELGVVENEHAEPRHVAAVEAAVSVYVTENGRARIAERFEALSG